MSANPKFSSDLLDHANSIGRLIEDAPNRRVKIRLIGVVLELLEVVNLATPGFYPRKMNGADQPPSHRIHEPQIAVMRKVSSEDRPSSNCDERHAVATTTPDEQLTS